MRKTARQLLLTPFVVLSLTAAAEAGAADVKDRAIRLSYVTAKESPYGLGVEKYAEIVAKEERRQDQGEGDRTDSGRRGGVDLFGPGRCHQDGAGVHRRRLRQRQGIRVVRLSVPVQ